MSTLPATDIHVDMPDGPVAPGLSAEVAELVDYLPQRPETPQAPQQLRFKPWHKPRKQFIRRKQWWQEIEALLNEHHMPPDNRVLRYLTLPSEDMIDVRVLTEELAGRDVRLKYLGYCDVKTGSRDDERMNLADNSVRESVVVEPSSIIVRERLEDAANADSLAFGALREHGPFHAVNIDLCQNFAAPRVENVYACVDAIASIVNLQIERLQKSWLLFVTTRVTPEHIDAAHLEAFVSAILENVARSREFKRQAVDLFCAEGLALTEKLARARELPFEDYKNLFCVGLGKWLLAYVSNSVPQLKLEMLPSYYYSVYAGNPDMLSLAYRCTLQTQAPADPTGLATGVGVAHQHENIAGDEVDLGLKILEKTKTLIDLDNHLAGSPTEMNAMILESARFLKLAGYNVDNYREFAERVVGTATAAS